jgi:hypothetical protein
VEQTTLSALGLQTAPNELGATPQGGNVEAENCVLLAPGVVGTRRGQASVGYALPAAGTNATEFQDTLIVHTTGNQIVRDTGSAFTAYTGTYAPPDASLLRMKFSKARDNLYFTSDQGVYRLDGVNRVPVLAGGPVAPDIISATANGTTSGFLGAGKSVAYRLVFGRKDAHGKVYLGPPSGRTIADNANANARNVDVTFPARNVDTQTFWQLYRSTQISTTEATNNGIRIYPSDDLALVAEQYFTSADITAGTVTYADPTPDSLLRTPLYTNARENARGFAAARWPPPLAKDIAQWQSRAWYANTRTFGRVTLNLLGCGPGSAGLTGLRLNDALLFPGLTAGSFESYVARTSESNLGDVKFFQLFTSGTVDSNIENTCRSFVNMVNRYSSRYRARYLSASNDAPGRVQVENLSQSAGTEFEVNLVSFVLGITSGSISRTGTTATITTSAAHGLVAGDTVNLSPQGTVDANFPTLSGATVLSSPAPTSTTFAVTWGSGTATSTRAYYVTRVTPVPQYAWAPPPPPATFTSATLVRTGGNTVTVTWPSSGGAGWGSFLGPGSLVPIESVTGVDAAGFPSGTKTVTSVVGPYSFTYTEAGSNGTASVLYQTGQRVTSDANEQSHFLYYSDPDDPEAVPLENYLPVGRAGAAILRIFPIGNYLYVFKEDGIFVVTGYSPDTFAPDQIPGGSTVRLVAPDSVVSVNERLFALTTMGVCQVSAGGVRMVSEDIDQELSQYFGPSLDNLRTQTFAVSRETDGFYILGMPALTGADSAPFNSRFCYVYSLAAGAWTRWRIARNWGLVRADDDVLVMGGTDTAVYSERYTQTAADYVDAEYTLTPTAWVPATRTLTVASASAVTVGDAVRDDNAANWVVTSRVGNVLTLSGEAAITAPAAATGLLTLNADPTALGSSVGGTINLTTVSVAGRQNVSATLYGATVSQQWNTSDASTASALAAAINADPTMSPKVLAQTMASLTGTQPGRILLTGIATNATGNSTVTVSGDGQTPGSLTKANLAGGGVASANATGWVEINGGSGTIMVTASGDTGSGQLFQSSVAWATSDAATASALANQINNIPAFYDPPDDVYMPFTAVAVGNRVNLTPRSTSVAAYDSTIWPLGTPGSGDWGNHIGLAVSGTGTSKSGDWLTGGSDQKAHGEIWIQNARGYTSAQIAQLVAAAINANGTTAAVVNANAAGNVVTLTADTPGTAGNSITLAAVGSGVTATSFTGGAPSVNVTGAQAILARLKWRAFVAGSPADEKQWRQVHAHFRQRSFRAGTLALSTDLNPTGATVELAPARAVDGIIPAYQCDTALYPGMPREPKKSRMGVPQAVQKGSYLNVAWSIREAYAVWWLNGITLVFEAGSEKSQF